MNKKALVQLGALTKAVELTHNKWVDGGHKKVEFTQLLALLKVVKSKLEDKSRGLLKTKVNYAGMAAYLIDNYEDMPYIQLRKEVVKIANK